MASKVIKQLLPLIPLWILFLFLEFIYVQNGLPILSTDLTFTDNDFNQFSYPVVKESIADDLLWTIFTVTGPVIHFALQFLKRDDYDLSTIEFCRIYATIPPIVSILTSLAKFTICAPRPNFLHRCLFAKNELSQMQDVPEYAKSLLGESFNITSCPNPDIAYVTSGLLSMPSGHSSQAFALFCFLYRLIAVHFDREVHPYILTTVSLFPLFCAGSRIADNQHHFMDVTAGSLMGIFLGNLIFDKMVKCRAVQQANNNEEEQVFKSSYFEMGKQAHALKLTVPQ